MSGFRAHISAGALAAAIGTTLVFFYALITDPLLLLVLFGIGVVASFMPDVDSDSGLAFHIIFGAFTAACAGAGLYYALIHYPQDWQWLIGLPFGVAVFVWIILGCIFKKFTKHRGIMHSIPAMVIAGLATFLVTRHIMEDNEIVQILFGLMAAFGYFVHLLLDELNAGINLDGSLFKPKKSLGTAMKLMSSSGMVTFFTYAILVFLAYLAFY